jgi:dTDP-glucose 4,6-dehydratase
LTILVTGAAGFIGSALCRHLVAAGASTVVGLDKLGYAASPEALDGLPATGRFRLVRLDVCDRQGLDALFREIRPSAVVHLAAETHVDRSIDDPGIFVQTNVVGTYTLLEVCRAYVGRRGADPNFRMLHVSTDEVYGSLGMEGAFTEDTPYAPNSPYSATKASADHLVRAWGRTYGLPVLVTNCSNNYGPYQFPEKLIPLMIIKAFRGEPLPVYGTGTNVRDWLHVDDHARALVEVLKRGRLGEKYNVGGGAERSNLDVVRSICSVMDDLHPLPGGRAHETLITFVQDRPGHDHRYAIDGSKLERDLGWLASKSFAGGLRTTVEWYLANASWWGPIMAERYRGERLGVQPVGVGV